MNSISKFSRLLLILHLCLLFSPITEAYRRGEPIDTDLRLNNLISEAHSHQQPRFGVNSHTKLQDVSKYDFVSLSFEDGLWGLPTFAVRQSAQRHLYRIVVTFIYTRNSLESIQGEAVYRNPQEHENDRVQVEYHWIREQELSMQAGGFVVMLVVLLTSIFFFLSACGMADPVDERPSLHKQGSSKRL